MTNFTNKGEKKTKNNKININLNKNIKKYNIHICISFYSFIFSDIEYFKSKIKIIIKQEN